MYIFKFIKWLTSRHWKHARLGKTLISCLCKRIHYEPIYFYMACWIGNKSISFSIKNPQEVHQFEIVNVQFSDGLNLILTKKNRIVILFMKRQLPSISTVLYHILPTSCPSTCCIKASFSFRLRITSLRIYKVKILELFERRPDQVVWKVSKGLILLSERHRKVRESIVARYRSVASCYSPPQKLLLFVQTHYA